MKLQQHGQRRRVELLQGRRVKLKQLLTLGSQTLKQHTQTGRSLALRQLLGQDQHTQPFLALLVLLRPAKLAMRPSIPLAFISGAN